jgi:hypothetical protein
MLVQQLINGPVLTALAVQVIIVGCQNVYSRIDVTARARKGGFFL